MKFAGLGLVSVEQGIILGLVVTGTCLLPWGLGKHLSIFAFISTLSVSRLTFYSRIPVLGWAHCVYCSRAPAPLHLEWPFPNTVTF